MSQFPRKSLLVLIVLTLSAAVWAQTGLDPSYVKLLTFSPSSLTAWSDSAGNTQLLIADAKKNALLMLDPLSGNTVGTVAFMSMAQFSAESLKVAKRAADIDGQVANLQSEVMRLQLDAKMNGDRADSARGVITQWQADKAAFDRETPALQKRIDDCNAALGVSRDAVTKAQDDIKKVQALIDEKTNKVAEQKSILDTAKRNATKYRATDRMTRYQAQLDSAKSSLTMATGTLTLANSRVVQSQVDVEAAQKVLDDKRARFATYETIVAGLTTIATHADQAKTNDETAMKPLPDKQTALQDEKTKNQKALEQLIVVENPTGLAVAMRGAKSYLFLSSQGTKRINVFELPSMNSVGMLANGMLISPSLLYVVGDKVWVLDDAGKSDAAIKSISFELSGQTLTSSPPVTFAGIANASKVTDFSVDEASSKLYVSINERLHGRIDSYDMSGTFLTSAGMDQFDGGAVGVALWNNPDGGFLWSLDAADKFRVFDRQSFRPLASIEPRKTFFAIDRMFICTNPVKGYPAGLVVTLSNAQNTLFFFDRSYISNMFGMPVAAK